MRFFEKFERVDEIVPLFLSFCKDFHRRRETNCLPESGREQERSAAVSFLQEIPLVQSIPDFSHFIFDNPRKRLYISTQRNQGEFCINESEKTLSGSLLVLTSCGDYIGKEKSHPFFVKAETSRNAGNYKEAAQYFEEFLNVCPRSPVVHYELGSLYTDHLNDPYKAVYHYQRYLELDRTSPDAENIRKDF